MIRDTSPVDFQSLPQNEQDAVQSVVDKIVTGCTVKTHGRDLLREVYLAGLYHGVKISKIERI